MSGQGLKDSGPHEGVVKWFDAARGFGFVVMRTCAGDAFIHAARLAQDGFPPVAQGDKLVCLVSSAPRGNQVSRVLDVVPACNPAALAAPSSVGRVKFYDVERGYGFIQAEDGQEVFVGAKALRRLGLAAPLRADQAVRFSAVAGHRGLVAETLTFLA